MKENHIGYITGETTTLEFEFVTEKELGVMKWDYLMVEATENIEGKETKVKILAQVMEMHGYSSNLDKYTLPSIVEKTIEQNILNTKIFGIAKVQGFINPNSAKKEVKLPRRNRIPGELIYLAPKDMLIELYSYPANEGLMIGNLIGNKDVPISITVKGFRRHLAVLAQTGAGKSYTAGVILEELFEKGATIIVFDPHADYVFFSHKRDGKGKLKRVNVFRTKESTGRYDEAEVGKINDYEIKFSDLNIEDIALIGGIQERYIKIVDTIEKALKELKGDTPGYKLDDLIERLEKKDDSESIRAARYARRMRRIKVFGEATTSVSKFLEPKNISVIDLSGLEDRVSNYIAYRILSDIYEKIESQEFKFPVFVVFEEAHRFIPVKESTYSKSIVKKIASEGRKFGIFLILITQRPYKIDQDALSQCNSQIIMRITNPADQNAVRSSSERMSDELLKDLPGLNVGEAIIVGEMTKAPVMVKIRERITREGGGDIDVVEKLESALKEIGTEKDQKEKKDKDLKKEVDMMKV